MCLDWKAAVSRGRKGSARRSVRPNFFESRRTAPGRERGRSPRLGGREAAGLTNWVKRGWGTRPKTSSFLIAAPGRPPSPQGNSHRGSPLRPRLGACPVGALMNAVRVAVGTLQVIKPLLSRGGPKKGPKIDRGPPRRRKRRRVVASPTERCCHQERFSQETLLRYRVPHPRTHGGRSKNRWNRAWLPKIPNAHAPLGDRERQPERRASILFRVNAPV